MSSVTVKGIQTEVKVASVEIESTKLVQLAIPHMKMRDIKDAFHLIMAKKLKKGDPTLPENAEINWVHKCWEIFAYTDHHKGDDVYKSFRPFNEEEEQMALSINALMSVFK